MQWMSIWMHSSTLQAASIKKLWSHYVVEMIIHYIWRTLINSAEVNRLQVGRQRKLQLINPVQDGLEESFGQFGLEMQGKGGQAEGCS